MRIVKQNRFKNVVELHKEWTEAGVKASKATTHRCVKEFGSSCRQRRHADELKATVKETWASTSAVPQTDHLHAMPNWGSN